jgi:rare lipoprotein A
MSGEKSVRIAACLFGVLLLLTACDTPIPSPRYHLGQPYQASGVWHYPRESFTLHETGLGSVLPASQAPLTTNGELHDPNAMAAAHATLQLPAIARLTNLETGLSTTVRINDRGTGNPSRLVEVTPRVATLVGMPANAAARVRLQVLSRESQDAAEALPGAPSLGIAAAPRGKIEVAELAPPPGIAARGGSTTRPASATETADTRPVISRLPEAVVQETPNPGRLMVRLGTFEEYQYASIQRARVAGLWPTIVPFREGRTRRYRVEMGPFPDVAQAEAAQSRALASGVPDARIVVD